jgi:hexosaminidase
MRISSLKSILILGLMASNAMCMSQKPSQDGQGIELVNPQLPAIDSAQVAAKASQLQVAPSGGAEELPPLIPAPTSLNMGSGFYTLHTGKNIVFQEGVDSSMVVNLLKSSLWKDLKSPLKALKVMSHNVPGVTPGIVLIKNSQFQGEAYQLDINNHVQIEASTYAGWLYGLKSLEQMLIRGKKVDPKQELPIQFRLPKLTIQDSPQHSWRGVMIDVSRHFFSIGILHKLVDRMSYYKLNKLHLHLSDDHGWRMEIKAYPNLTQVGAQSQVGGHPLMGEPKGYFTQEQIKGLIAYAKRHNVEVIPEFDMPGHVYAALAAVPELNCKDGSNIHANAWEKNPPKPPTPYHGTKVGWNKLCLTEEAPYEFFAKVMQETAEIFESPYIHVGGDEIKDTLYPHFIRYADSVIRSHGKIMIGWEEVLEANVDEKTIAQIWRRVGRSDGRRLALNKKSPVILSPCENFYLDHGNVEGQPGTMSWCAQDVTLGDIYNYQADPRIQLLGFEAPVWTEFVQTEADLDDRYFPRLLAVSERTWSITAKSTGQPMRDPNAKEKAASQEPVTTKVHPNFKNFQMRLKAHEMDMKSMGIEYYGSQK